jgi:hypothetical protein
MLVYKGPIGAPQHPAFGLGHCDRVARTIGAGIEDDGTCIRLKVAGQTV